MSDLLSGTPELDTWLTLSEAAARLDVHPTTLRRWADNGEIPVMVTPGGHRRFSAADLAHFARVRRSLRNISGLADLWASKALSNSRQDVVAARHEGWLSHFDDRGRARNRLLGRQLMGLTLQYLSNDLEGEGGGPILDEARNIGRQYAANARELGLPLRVTLEASMFFRDSLIETALHLPETVNIRPEANVRLVKRVNQLLNAVHLAVAEVYDEQDG